LEDRVCVVVVFSARQGHKADECPRQSMPVMGLTHFHLALLTRE